MGAKQRFQCVQFHEATLPFLFGFCSLPGLHILRRVKALAQDVLSQPNHNLNIARFQPKLGVLAPGSAHSGTSAELPSNTNSQF